MNNNRKQLPKINTKIKISSPFYTTIDDNIDCLILITDSYLYTSGTQEALDLDFLYLAIEIYLEPQELLQVHKNLTYLQNNWVTDKELSCSELFMSVMYTLGKNFILKWDEIRYKLTSQISFLTKDQQIYDDLPDWTFCNYWNLKIDGKEDLLIGYLYFCERSGGIFLSDNKTEIPCVIIGNTKNILNKYVIITDHVGFVEVFRDKTGCFTIEYLLIKRTNIFNLNITRNESSHKKIDKIGKNLFRCDIISKSQLILKPNGALGFWLEIVMDALIHAYIYLDKIFVDMYSSLNAGEIYEVCHEEVL